MLFKLLQIGSAGTYSLSSVPAGRKVLKVIVKDVVRKERKVVRIGLPLPENDDVCYTHLINRGWRVDGDRFTVEFTSTGNAQGYTCVLDRMYELDKCKLVTLLYQNSYNPYA